MEDDIDGMLQGNGQVYIYNPNGIIFGKSSRVDVNSLVATTLKIDDNRFLAGLIAPSAAPIFAAAGGAAPGAVVVEGERNSSGVIEQAQLNAARFPSMQSEMELPEHSPTPSEKGEHSSLGPTQTGGPLTALQVLPMLLQLVWAMVPR